MKNWPLAVVAAGAASLAGAYLETKAFVLRRVDVPVLPPGCDDVRVLHISDLHLTPGQRRKLEWLRSLADLAPDLVVNTGDNLAHSASVAPLLDALGPLLARPGVFVNGSNDYWAPVPKNPARYLMADPRRKMVDPTPLPWPDMVDGFTSAGWADLNNHRATVTLADGRRLSFVGTDDPHLEWDVMPAPDEAGGTDEADKAALLHIGVTHAPYQRVLNQFRDDGARLILAGHTHGGQLRLPGVGALVTNCDLDRRRAAGLSGWPGARPSSPLGKDSVWLHVSAGAGTSPYTPFRLFCRPEATLLTLTAPPAA